MPNVSFWSKDNLMDQLHEWADYSTEEVCDELRAIEERVHRARTEFVFLMHYYRVDPDNIPPAGPLLKEVGDALSRPTDAPYRWLNMNRPTGRLVGFPRTKQGMP